MGVKILSFVFRQLTEDFKEEKTDKESVQYQIQILYSINNLNYFAYSAQL